MATTCVVVGVVVTELVGLVVKVVDSVDESDDDNVVD